MGVRKLCGIHPVIFPGVLGVRMVFSWWSYLPLVMLPDFLTLAAYEHVLELPD